MPLAEYNVKLAELKKKMGYLTQKAQRDTGSKSKVTLAEVRAATRAALGMGPSPRKASPRRAGARKAPAAHKKHVVPNTRGMKIGRGYSEYCSIFKEPECRKSPGCQWKGGKTQKCVKGWGKAKYDQQFTATNAARNLQARFRNRSTSRGTFAHAAARAAAERAIAGRAHVVENPLLAARAARAGAGAAGAGSAAAGAGSDAAVNAEQAGGYWW